MSTNALPRQKTDKHRQTQITLSKVSLLNLQDNLDLLNSPSENRRLGQRLVNILHLRDFLIQWKQKPLVEPYESRSTLNLRDSHKSHQFQPRLECVSELLDWPQPKRVLHDSKRPIFLKLHEFTGVEIEYDSLELVASALVQHGLKHLISLVPLVKSQQFLEQSKFFSIDGQFLQKPLVHLHDFQPWTASDWLLYKPELPIDVIQGVV